MIGSHDTFTYLKPTNPICNLFKRWWKCQCRTIDEQYEFGIKFFDIRVVWHRNRWYFAHGLVTLNFNYLKFKTLYQLCGYIEYWYPKAIYRLVLERGSEKVEKKFTKEVKLLHGFKNLWRVDIKSHKTWNGEIYNQNEAFLKLGYKFAKVNTWEAPAYELHGCISKDNWNKVRLKKEAKNINSNLDFFKDSNKLEEMKNSKDELYFLDYCTNQY